MAARADLARAARARVELAAGGGGPQRHDRRELRRLLARLRWVRFVVPRRRRDGTRRGNRVDRGRALGAAPLTITGLWFGQTVGRACGFAANKQIGRASCRE